MSKIKNPRPSAPDLTVNIGSSADKVVITIPCFLHPNDSDRIYDVLFEFLKTCTKTEAFLDKMEAEAKEREEYFKNNPQS